MVDPESQTTTQETTADATSCPICLETFRNPYLSRCGHSFCFCCIESHLQTTISCPLCHERVLMGEIFPNYTLNALIQGRQSSRDIVTPKKATLVPDKALSIQDIDMLLRQLQQQKAALQCNQKEVIQWLAKKFLLKIKEEKVSTIWSAYNELQVLKTDLLYLGADLKSETFPVVMDEAEEKEKVEGVVPEVGKKRKLDDTDIPFLGASFSEEDQKRAHDLLNKLFANFKEIEAMYYETRGSDSEADLFTEKIGKITKYAQMKPIARIYHRQPTASVSSMSYLISSIDLDKDDEFFASAGVERKVFVYDYNSIIEERRERGNVSARELQKEASNNNIAAASSTLLRRRSTFNRQHSSNSILSVINETAPPEETAPEADEYADDTSLHIPNLPIREINVQTKLSCVAWSPYVKSQLAASDYEGIVHIWDVSTGKETCRFEEHERRAWAVDYCAPNPNVLCSAGDDGKVKIWALNTKSSTHTLGNKTSICAVKFHPTKRHELVFGSADHKITYYDLRNTKVPVIQYTAHSKAVSYVRYINDNEILSASTDCTLRTWKVPTIPEEIVDFKTQISKSFTTKYTGHKNEKNFVGLGASKSGEFFASGSEDNSVYIYSRELTNAWITTPFGQPLNTFRVSSTAQSNGANTNPHFVSCVAWNKATESQLICGNSAGLVNIYEMI